ncbi:hypothetical protein DPMN_140029 [Dreissena polymorpha]|uniref:Uncharacterized protein n=1 Tax=Dreissena polymorpha TaxID=45954 RepID=A0A9D4G7D9_DREPO|nr:hypothetical protein DPMN_140029 [Dreissena polymorpha]
MFGTSGDFSSNQHPFYLAIRTIDTASQWFLRQQLGVNKLGQMLKAMAKDVGFTEHMRITNHSVRANSWSKNFERQTFHPLTSWS